MIKLKNVSFKYKSSEDKVLNNINFSVKDGEIVAIVGKNGSGNSTIGKLISGITKLKEGEIYIDDLEVSKGKKEVGIVFQNPENQIIFNNIYDELSFSLKNMEKSEIEDRINYALKEVGMIEFKESDLYSLSLGQKQRIMIAEVLAKKPKYIILDEPTTMIDSQGKEKIYGIIKKLKEDGFTIICITNIADEILLADRTLILNDGKIIHEIKKEELMDKAYLLKDFGIKNPTILDLLIKLKENGINLDLKEFTVNELVKELKVKLYNEKAN